MKNKLRRWAVLIAFLFVATMGILSGLIEAYKAKYKLGKYRNNPY